MDATREVDFSTEGRGLGLVAARDVAAGEVVLHETAVLPAGDGGGGAALAAALGDAIVAETGVELETDLLEAVLRHLAPAVRPQVLTLCSAAKRPMFDEYLGDAAATIEALLKGVDVKSPPTYADFVTLLAVIQENSFMDPAANEVVLFLRGSRVNHACLGAANAEPHVEGSAIKFTARRAISTGEEILIDYLNQENETLGYQARQEAIEGMRGFVCRCAVCTAEAASGPHRNPVYAEAEGRVHEALEAGAAAEAMAVLADELLDTGLLPRTSPLMVHACRELRGYAEATGQYDAAAAFARCEAGALPAATLSRPRALCQEGLNARRHHAQLPRPAAYADFPLLPAALASRIHGAYSVPPDAAPVYTEAVRLVESLLPEGAAHPVARLVAQCVADAAAGTPPVGA
eukprot:TRINITY_DN32583_c0_g1_i1.p1 TRINITY_DN32583_c0_g1~~TRINITY_DN32583_c0_g1_i1.p1  ORF type:complete len:405 (+),score=128.66 TRINITY_DN32583_c0_g1_i1:73-1287(+)